MTARLVAWCSRHHWFVIGAAVVLAAICELGRRALSRDAIPDLSDPQVVLLASWMGHPPSEVADRVTHPLTESLEGVPGSKAVRGVSMSGMAYVDVSFDSSEEIAVGRQAILERVDKIRTGLPKDVRLEVGPAASSTGWVFQYALVDPAPRPLMRSHADPSPVSGLRQVQDLVIRPALRAIPGVAEVASVGGEVSQVILGAYPEQLRARGLAFSDVLSTFAPLVRGIDDPWPTLDRPIEGVPVAPGVSPPRLDDVVDVAFDDDMPTGVADLSGDRKASVVGGIVIVDREADPAAVVEEVKRTLDELAPQLKRARIVTIYDRSDFIERIGETLRRALTEEVAVVVVVILLFLLHARSALIPLTTLPIVLLLTFGGMWLLGVPATVMSLGGIGIALGMAVDAEVVALEASHRSLERLGAGAPPEERRRALVAAAGAFAPAILTSLLIAALTFLPVLAFTGESGRLLRPLAIAKTLVILAAALVTLTLAPALRDRLLRGRVRAEFDNRLIKSLVSAYRPFVNFALRRPLLTLVTAALAVVSCLPIATRLGGEFLPRVDEGDLLFMPTTLAGVTPGESAVQLSEQDRAIAAFGEVASVFGKVGRADTPTDPAPYSMVETTIRLRPLAERPTRYQERWHSGVAPDWLKSALALLWPEHAPASTAQLVAELDRATRLPGWRSAWTAPVRARMDMMATGIRTPVGIRIVAASPARLEALGTQLQEIASGIEGTRSAVFESSGGEAWPRFVADPAALARHGVDPARVAATADRLLAGGQIGEVEWKGERYRVRVVPDMDNMSMNLVARVQQLRDVTVRSSANEPGQPVPLSLLGHTAFFNEPAVLRSEGGELVAYVHVDLEEGVNPAQYVESARQQVARHTLGLQPGERIEWAGQYELLREGQERLKWIALLVALLMFLLLFLQFRSVSEALIVLVSVPFALVGSFWTLFALDYPLSAPVWVGLLSTVGLAMQTGVVMVVYIDHAFHRRLREGTIRTREDIIEAHAEGTVLRLRPKIMTVTTMAAALLPLLWTESAGSEIMKRVAAPMLGGLLTSAFLTLEVLPVLYTLWRTSQLRHARRTGKPLAQVVGRVPAWARS
jgi:copper/silver efflux system protein